MRVCESSLFPTKTVLLLGMVRALFVGNKLDPLLSSVVYQSWADSSAFGGQ